MPESRGPLREIAWQELFPWLELGAAVRLALRVQPLVLAALAVLATTAGWRLIGSAFAVDDSHPIQAAIQRDSLWVWDHPAPTLDQPAGSRLESQAAVQLSRPFLRLFDPRASLVGFAYSLLCGLWALVVWGLFGGAICRQAAVALARHDRMNWSEAVGFARNKWLSFFTAPLYPLVGVLIATVPLLLVGLLLHTGVTSVLAGLMWPVVVLGGFFMAVLLVGMLAGWPLMWATISVEGTDAFDAISRTYSYVYQRPARYAFYLAVAVLIGAAGWLLVALFEQATLALGQWAVSWGSGQENLSRILSDKASGFWERGGQSLVLFFNRLVPLVAVAYLSSYFWTVSTAIYYQLRRDVDATEPEEVYLPEEETDYALPPLADEASDAPAAAATP